MRDRAVSRLIPTSPPLVLGIVVAVVLIASQTLVMDPERPVAPEISLGAADSSPRDHPGWSVRFVRSSQASERSFASERLPALRWPRRGAPFAGRMPLAFGVLAACAGCASSLTVRVMDNRLLDGNGQPVRLLGVNRSGAEYACISGIGFFAGPSDQGAIAAMTSWHINAVRIPLNEDCWLGINGVPAQYGGVAYQTAIREFVGRLHAAGLYVVLDLHWNAPGSTPARSQQPMADLDHAPAFWSSVARAFAQDRAVVFDLYNEPRDIRWQCWRKGCLLPRGWRTAGMQTLVDAVRSSGARQPIILTALGSGNDMSSWLRYRPHDPANQLVAGFHAYDTLGCATTACWKAQVKPVARRVPVVTAELGEGGCSHTFIDKFMRWADSAGVSYLGWSWNPSGCSAPSLITSWDGHPTAYGGGLKAHLIKLR
jgi:hypothetical protein